MVYVRTEFAENDRFEHLPCEKSDSLCMDPSAIEKLSRSYGTSAIMYHFSYCRTSFQRPQSRYNGQDFVNRHSASLCPIDHEVHAGDVRSKEADLKAGSPPSARSMNQNLRRVPLQPEEMMGGARRRSGHESSVDIADDILNDDA